MDVSDLISRGNDMFAGTNPFIPSTFVPAEEVKTFLKSGAFALPGAPKTIQDSESNGEKKLLLMDSSVGSGGDSNDERMEKDRDTKLPTNGALIEYSSGKKDLNKGTLSSSGESKSSASGALVNRKQEKVPVPTWHAPWELSAVISGHLGWVRSICMDASNEWFATGSADRTIKIWDLAKCCAGVDGGLKLTLTGHISAVRGISISPRHPYLFSVGEDKLVKCWDLEYNKIIRHYHGHLSGVYCCALHPSLDLLVTGGRDSVARVWDMRTKHQIHCLGGHSGTVSSLFTSPVDPQIVTGSQDSTIKTWDLAAGKAITTLTQHKKAVRCVVANPRELTFASAGADNIKKWQNRDGKFLRNLSGHNAVVNSLAINEDGVLFSGGDNGTMRFWDYESGFCFQKTETIVQPGSLDAEAGIYASIFDLTGSRLITCEADKSIKIWKENSDATEDRFVCIVQLDSHFSFMYLIFFNNKYSCSHPIDMKAWSKECLALKRY